MYGGESATGNGNVSMVVRRQIGFSFEASCRAEFHFEDNEDAAGLILFQNEKKLQIIVEFQFLV